MTPDPLSYSVQADAALAIGNELDAIAVEEARRQRDNMRTGIETRFPGALTPAELKEVDMYPATHIKTWEEGKRDCEIAEQEAADEADVMDAMKYFGWAEYDMAQEEKYKLWYKDRLRMGDRGAQSMT
jgi:hypothetical protein